MEKKHPLSVCIVAFNEEKKIGMCLEAVSWADDIVVVDSFSTDRTAEICREFTPRVIQRKWTGYLAQKKYALGLTKHEWVLLVDADEILTGELAREIRRELEKNDGSFNGYYFRRKLYYLGRWLKRGEWYPDYKLRLFRKTVAAIGGMEPHDNIYLKNGKAKYLNGEMLHYSYENIFSQVNVLNKYSTISARGMFERGVRTPFLRMLLHPLWRFFVAYFIRKGFMDGIPGLVIAVVNSFYVFLKYAKLWELNLAAKGIDPFFCSKDS